MTRTSSSGGRLGLVGARPVEQKKGADKGIDGRIYFHEGNPTDLKQIILSVKAGRTFTATSSTSCAASWTARAQG